MLAKPKLPLPAMLVVCLLLSLLAYANTLPNPFIWDDEGLIVNNALIRSPGGWRQALSGDLFAGTFSGSNFYRPLQSLSFMLDFRLWHFNPAGYHLTNILLHAAVAFLIFVFLAAISSETAVSAAAAALFAVHPMHTEVVAYIAGRADMLMAIALLAAFITYGASERSRGPAKIFWYAVSLAGFAAGLMAKELAVVFPVALFARGVFLRDRARAVSLSGSLRPAVPFLFLSAGYVIMRLTVLHFTTEWQPELSQYPVLLRFMMLPKVLAAYAGIIFFPVNMHMSRTLMRPVTAEGMAGALAAAVFIVCATAVLLYKLRARPAAGFLTAWALVFFLPQSGIFPINAFVAEHFIHLASAGIFYGAARVLRRTLRPRAFWAAVAGLTVLLALLTAARNYEWRDPVVFYRDIISHSPDSYLAHNNLGVQYDRRGDYEKAIAEFEAAQRIKPLRTEAHSNIADAYYKLGRYEESLAAYRIVETIVPASRAGEIQNNIGNVYLALQRYPQAQARYDLALKLDPALFYVHYNRARLLRALGRADEAAGEVVASLRSSAAEGPDESQRFRAVVGDFFAQGEPPACPVQFYTRLGIRASEAGLLNASLACMDRALAIAPVSADAHFNRALALMKKGRVREARAQLREALRFDPAHSRARALLGAAETLPARP